MKLKDAIQSSPEKVAIIIQKVDCSIQIITASIGWDKDYVFDNIIYENGSFSRSGGLFKNEAPIKNSNWKPLNATLLLH